MKPIKSSRGGGRFPPRRQRRGRRDAVFFFIQSCVQLQGAYYVHRFRLSVSPPSGLLLSYYETTTRKVYVSKRDAALYGISKKRRLRRGGGSGSRLATEQPVEVPLRQPALLPPSPRRLVHAQTLLGRQPDGVQDGRRDERPTRFHEVIPARLVVHRPDGRDVYTVVYPCITFFFKAS